MKYVAGMENGKKGRMRTKEWGGRRSHLAKSRAGHHHEHTAIHDRASVGSALLEWYLHKMT